MLSVTFNHTYLLIYWQTVFKYKHAKKERK